MNRDNMLELANLVATAVVDALEKKNVLNCGNNGTNSVAPKQEKTAYQKTEQLLYNYNSFKRIIKERMLEIETIRTYGVPTKSKSIVEYTPGGGSSPGIVLDEEIVEAAVRNVEASVHDTVEALALIDKCMVTLKADPYYEILEMRYFEGRTQEDIAEHFNCSQVTISKNKNRLVRELSLRIFPDQTISEMMK